MGFYTRTNGVGGAAALTTVGAIPYVTSAGVLGQDAGALFWDATNDWLGVGTASPTHTLTVNGVARVSSSNTGGTMYIGGDPATGGNFTGRFIVASNRLDIDSILIGSGFRPITLNAAGGNVLIGTTTDLGYGLHAANKGTNGNLLVFDPTATTGTSKAVFVAGQGQSGNLTEWRAYNATPGSGTLVAYVSSSGDIVGEATYGRTIKNSIAGTAFAFHDGAYSTAGGYFQSTFPLVWNSDSGFKRSAAGYMAVTDGSTGLGKIVVSQSTPAASTDAGTAGAIWADATYIYVQTAAGTVKRIALTTF